MKIRPPASEFFHVDGRTDRLDEAHTRFWTILIMRPKYVL